MSKLNANAKTFNPNAKAFVPTSAKPAGAPAVVVAPVVSPPSASSSSSAAAAPAPSVVAPVPIAVKATPAAAPVTAPSPPAESWENDIASSPPGGPELKEVVTSVSQLAIEEKLSSSTPPPAPVPVTKLDLDTPASKPIVIDDDDPELKLMIAEEEELDKQKEQLKPKSKKGAPEEFKVHDTREHLNIVFIGHVDAGKSTMSGQILLLTGQVDERTIQKYEREAKEKNRESWYLAYIMDTNEEERAKGKTVEVGRAHFATANKRYTLLDAPGHKNYVPNMIGGAAQADIAILIISARKGEFETGFERGGQTREHALLAKTLGVHHLIVAVNKMDDPTVQWSKERYDKIVNDLMPFLKKCNYKPKEVTFVPCSGFTGANVKEVVTDSVCPWLNPRKSLLQILDELPTVPRDENGPLRIPVVARYKEMGVVVVLGKVECGTISKGMKLLMAPINKELICDAIEVDDAEVNMAKPGENVNIKVKGCEEEEVQTGFVIGDIKRPPALAMMMEAQLLVLDLLPHKPLLTAGYFCILHVHTAIVECQIVDLIAQMDPKTGQKMKRKPAFAKAGAVMIVKLAVEQTVACEKYKDVGQLGRFSLRDEGKTIAIGKFLQLSAVSTVKKEEFETKE